MPLRSRLHGNQPELDMIDEIILMVVGIVLIMVDWS